MPLYSVFLVTYFSNSIPESKKRSAIKFTIHMTMWNIHELLERTVEYVYISPCSVKYVSNGYENFTYLKMCLVFFNDKEKFCTYSGINRTSSLFFEAYWKHFPEETEFCPIGIGLCLIPARIRDLNVILHFTQKRRSILTHDYLFVSWVPEHQINKHIQFLNQI